MILPTLPYSCAEEHRGFPGSIWLRKETFANVLEDVCRSLEDCARMLCIVSWHGGNDEPLSSFMPLLNQRVSYEVKYLELMDKQIDAETERMLNGPIDDHAGNTELSMMQAIYFDTVKAPPADYAKSVITNPFTAQYLKDVSADGIADNHPEWIVDEKIGNAILDLYGKRLGLLVRECLWWIGWDLNPRPKD